MLKKIFITAFLFLFVFNSMAFGMGYIILPFLFRKSPPPPTYYSWEDLKQQAKEQSQYLYFDNSSPPSDALAYLPKYPVEFEGPSAASAKRGAVTLSAMDVESFPWASLGPALNKGDLIFLRCGGPAGYITRYVSSFTHVAMVWDPYKPRTFESLRNNGVALYNPREYWSNVVCWSVKRAKTSQANINQALDKALALYSGRPYFPQVKVNDMDKIANFAKWADKYDLSSMYCSKLVYHTFKLAGLDLDSGRTRTANSRIAKIKDTDYAGKINNGWGGVSPDDIYYSKNLGKDLYYSNLHKLNSVFSWSLF